jgi:hypothetical protein
VGRQRADFVKAEQLRKALANVFGLLTQGVALGWYDSTPLAMLHNLLLPKILPIGG